MGAIRHYIAFLGCILVLAFASGVRPAVWTGTVVIIVTVLHRSASLVPSGTKHAGSLIIMVYILSLLSLGTGVAFLFRHFGWLAAIAAPVIALVFLLAKEDESRQWERAIGTARTAILNDIAKSRSGVITPIQLRERSNSIFEHLPEQAYYISSVREPLLSNSLASPEDYRTYLELLESYVARNSIYYRELLNEIRARLKN
jgi:hypothetical protein